jgi:hypothetical protein
VQKATGKIPEGLEPPTKFPQQMLHVWSHFIELSSARTSGMGINPISFTEIKSWSELTDTPVSSRDIQAIKKLDSVYLKVMNSGTN